MTKIETFHKQKQIAINLRKCRDCAFGLDSKNNDKHRFYAEFVKCHPNSWNDVTILIHASYGYYGSSSGYSAMNEDVGHYLAKAISQMGNQLFDKAVTLAEQDTEKARQVAEDEARAVLTETGK